MRPKQLLQLYLLLLLIFVNSSTSDVVPPRTPRIRHGRHLGHHAAAAAAEGWSTVISPEPIDRRSAPAAAAAGAATNTTDVMTFKLAVLLPDASKRQKSNWRFSIQKVRPAIELALSQIEANIQRQIGSDDEVKGERRAESFRFEVNYADSKCHIGAAINEAIQQYCHQSPIRRPDVILGPFCDYAMAPVARQVSCQHHDVTMTSLAHFVANTMPRMNQLAGYILIFGSFVEIAGMQFDGFCWANI